MRGWKLCGICVELFVVLVAINAMFTARVKAAGRTTGVNKRRHMAALVNLLSSSSHGGRIYCPFHAARRLFCTNH